MLAPDEPLAILMTGALGESHGKMGYGVLRYSPNPVVAVVDPAHAGRDVREMGLSPRAVPVVATVAEAAARGARALVLGTAPPGGRIPAEWELELQVAADAGMLLVNGLHDPLAGRFPRVWDVRQEPEGLAPGTGAAAKLGVPRLLTVGTDMAVGKMTAALELTRAILGAKFVATGQIGIVISGGGVPLDAVRVDFASGAVEREVIRAAVDASLVVVEGQGSLAHPGSTATLPLLRGSMPTHLLLCARAAQTHLARLPQIEIPPLREMIALYEELAAARGAFPRPRTLGVALNTAHLGQAEAERKRQRVEDEVGLPCIDPIRDGVARLVAALN